MSKDPIESSFNERTQEINCSCQDCSFAVVRRDRGFTQVNNATPCYYGTSDATINGSELLMSLLLGCQTFVMYALPLEIWGAHEKDRYSPYPVPSEEEWKAVGAMRLFSFQNFVRERVAVDILDLPLEQVAARIKETRARHSFLVLHESGGLNGAKPVFCNNKDQRWKDKYAFVSLREILTSSAHKLGGGLLYFLIGAAGEPVLAPHTSRGDVWNAFLAGASMARVPARIRLCGYLEIVTDSQIAAAKQRSKQLGGIFKKPPPWLVRIVVQRHGDELKTRLFQKESVLAVYNEQKDEVSFRDSSECL